MVLPTYTTTCTSKRLVARGVYEFTMTKPKGFTWIAGQYILFQIPLIEKPEDIQTRALSIASLPQEDEMLFVAKIIPGGRLSRWIEEVLKEGVSAKFQGPFGRFVLEKSEKDHLFIATGTGLAPFRPMMESLTANRIDIVFGVKSEEDLFWKDWLAELGHSHPGVCTHIVLSQPSPHWKGHKGRVQMVAPLVVNNDFSNKKMYVCGSPEMTNDVRKMAMVEWGVEKKDIHVEGYI